MTRAAFMGQLQTSSQQLLLGTLVNGADLQSVHIIWTPVEDVDLASPLIG